MASKTSNGTYKHTLYTSKKNNEPTPYIFDSTCDPDSSTYISDGTYG